MLIELVVLWAIVIGTVVWFVRDERRLKAFVHSAPLSLPENGGKLRLELAEGVASTLGGDGHKGKLEGLVELPSLYSVNIDSADTALVDNERFEPEQVLVLGFNNAMKDSEVAGATRAWLTDSRLEYTMYVSRANSRFTERPARGLTKLIGMASSASTSADSGMPMRQSSSPRFARVGSSIRPSVEVLLWVAVGSLPSRVWMRVA